MAVPHLPGEGAKLVAALVEGLSYQAGADARAAPALLLRGALEEGIRGADAVSGVLDLLRRRFTAFHGEIRATPSVSLFSSRREVEVHVGRERFVPRVLVLAAPGSLIRDAMPRGQTQPRWLRSAPPAFPVPTRLVRADRKALSSGMSARVVDGTEPGQTRWVARSVDPADDSVEWIVIRAATIASLQEENPLGLLAPFAEGHLLPVEPGPPVWWDLGGAEVRIGGRGWRTLRSRRPLVLTVGPDQAPTLGAEGELLSARRVGVWLAETLSARHRSPRVSSGR
jgi:hypothetical protein